MAKEVILYENIYMYEGVQGLETANSKEDVLQVTLHEEILSTDFFQY